MHISKTDQNKKRNKVLIIYSCTEKKGNVSSPTKTSVSIAYIVSIANPAPNKAAITVLILFITLALYLLNHFEY